MKLSVLVVLSVLLLELTNAQATGSNSSRLLHVVRRSAPFPDEVNLQWVRWTGSLPSGAVSIYNDYTERTDYVCKSSCQAGFYTPSKGLFCFYPYGDTEIATSVFEILVNKDDFVFLEWKEDSYGSVPKYSVRTCSGVDIYVGKNEYGLGKVDSRNEAFFLPWEGDEYWYKTYQVLVINREPYSQHISHVKYAIDEVEIFRQPPETMRMSRITNNACQTVVKTVTIEKTTEVESTWNTESSTTLGVTSGITVEVPFIASAGIEFSAEKTLTFSEGTSKMEGVSHSVSVELKVPPNHSCSARMEGRKMTIGIPYTARLNRTNQKGVTKWTSIFGVYKGVQMGEIRAVVARCEAAMGAEPCP